MTATLVALVLAVPAAAFTLWPILRRRDRPARLLPLPSDERLHLLEAKGAALGALRELDFEHGAGHVSDADYAELRARYETEAAAALRGLDALGPAPAPAAPVASAPAPGRGWRHPAALAAAALALLVFGVGLGVGIVRYTEPDRSADAPPPGSRPLASLEAPAGPGAPSAANAPRGPVTPEMLQGMLEAARASLFAGRYGEAIAAYQAVLKRDPNNVDALTHMGLIAGVAARGEHGPEMIDRALGLFDRALALSPDYPPALLYRGQVLYEAKKDAAGAIRSWERFVKVVPPGDDRTRVEKMIAEAKAGRPLGQ
ncbi:MAG TPA: tetratricopeptide repeat protein [Methylomirabilota bacterium]|jgi:tetratricopeptide (TPR) repeat protein|nr:tetratricopeptide repeat protein [Methylomirabilota bacterium]